MFMRSSRLHTFRFAALPFLLFPTASILTQHRHIHTMEIRPEIHTSFEPVTGTWQYIVADPTTREAAIIDPVLDYDPVTSTISTGTADALLRLAAEHNLRISRVMETHAHADHLTAARYIQSTLQRNDQPRAPICIGRRITEVQRTLGPKYNIDP